MSTLYQDNAGTTPVTAVGQSVGLVMDKSGNSNNAQAYNATLQQDANGKYYIDFNGTSTYLVTGSIDLSATNAISVFGGVNYAGEVAYGIICESSTDSRHTDGTFLLANQYITDNDLTMGANLGSLFGAVDETSDLTFPRTFVMSATIDGTLTDFTRFNLRYNSVAANDGTFGNPSGTGNFANYPIYIGSHAGTTNFHSGRIYSLIVRGAMSTPTEVSNTETYINSNTQAY